MADPAAVSEPEGPGDAAATVADWRARGVQRVDPLRFAFLEAMLRRTQGRTGKVRRLLDARLAQLVAAYAALVEAAPAKPAARVDAQPGALAELTQRLARPAPASEGPAPAAARPMVPSEPAQLAYFRKTWSRLSADSRVSQSQAKVPENAGPLNSHHLVHRALAEMRALSPEYLQHFLAHVDTLMWLAQVQEAAASPAPAAKGEAERKPARARKAAKPS